MKLPKTLEQIRSITENLSDEQRLSITLFSTLVYCVKNSLKTHLINNDMNEPYFTPEERKEKFTHVGDYFFFETCCDLSVGVKIKPLREIRGDALKWTPLLVRDTTCFISYWMITCHSRLNSFSGLDTIKYTIEL